MSLLRRLSNLLRPRGLARDIEREMHFHIAERADDLRGGGMDESDALREARRRFGNRTSLGERMRDVDIVTWLDSVAADIRYAVRALRRSPAFALVAVGSLAIGIGANTAIYSLIDAVLLRPLAVSRPGELAMVARTDPRSPAEGSPAGGVEITNPIWEAVRDRQNGFATVAAFGDQDFNLADGGEPRLIRGTYVSGEYFRVFDTRPAAGRLLAPADDVRGCPPVGVLGHGFWASEYGSSAAIVGRTISLSGTPVEVVGVTAPGFRGPEVGREVQVFVPLCAEAVIRGPESTLDRRSTWWLTIIGRRASGVTLEELGTRLARIAPAVYEATMPTDWQVEHQKEYLATSLTALPAEHGVSPLRTQYGKSLTILMSAVALLLLISCANVGNLLLARATSRGHEVAIRLAVGAGRGRLVRQLLTESALLAIVGAAAGILLARWVTPALVALISTPRNPVVLDLAINARVLGFTAAVSALTTMLFGLLPAWRGTRVSPQSAMRAHGRGVAEGHGRFTIGKALVATQVALSLALLVGAGLLIGTLRNLATLSPGFEPGGVLIALVDLRRAGMPDERHRDAHREVLERVRVIPGVRSASASQLTPVGRGRWNGLLRVDGFTPKSEQDALAWINEVSDGYFATLHTRFLAGRDFDHTDVAGAAKTVIVNDALARKFFGDGSPIGRTLRLESGPGEPVPYTVIGVVENAKYSSLREEESPTLYLAGAQSDDPGPRIAIEARGDGDAMALAPAVKAALLEMHPAASVEFVALERQLASSLRRERLLAVLSGAFGALALLLSTLGLYGVMTYTVARRRNEIGVRIALGADRDRVLRMVLGDVARVVAIGLVIGGVVALASGRLVQSLLYGLEPADPRVMLLAAATLATVALAAGLVPAWRAARVDPTTALREE